MNINCNCILAYVYKHVNTSMLIFINIVTMPQIKGVDFVFYDTYCRLCEGKGMTPSGAAAKIGFNRASVTMWKNSGKAPKQDLLIKIADFFGVTTDYLLGKPEKENTPALTEKDRRDIAKDLKAMLEQLDSGNDLMFDGNPMTEEAKESIRAAMKLGMEAAKLKNKERFGHNKR